MLTDFAKIFSSMTSPGLPFASHIWESLPKAPKTVSFDFVLGLIPGMALVFDNYLLN